MFFMIDISYQIILNISWIIFVMFIWFNTDAFIWWSRLFKLDKVFKIPDWNNYRLSINPKLKYLDYLVLKHLNFFIKVISCKPCLLFWITLIVLMIEPSKIVSMPIYYLISYIIYTKIIDRDGK
jgi:hypothetical protein